MSLTIRFPHERTKKGPMRWAAKGESDILLLKERAGRYTVASSVSMMRAITNKRGAWFHDKSANKLLSNSGNGRPSPALVYGELGPGS